MGREKEEMLEREERAVRSARNSGAVCIYDSKPLLTADEKADRVCADCKHKLGKND